MGSSIVKRSRTYVASVIDESGSMASLRRAVVDGYHEQMTCLKQTPAAVRASLTLFNTEARSIYAGVPIALATGLDKVYQPDGGTALYDAVAEAIHSLDQMEGDEDAFIVIVMTDGQDTDSTTTLDEVRALVQAREQTGRWTFIFLGTDIRTGTSMGFGTTLKLTASADGVRQAMQEITDQTTRLLLTSGGPTIYSS